MNEINLKPCPFCGSGAKLVSRTVDLFPHEYERFAEPERRVVHYVTCLLCLARTHQQPTAENAAEAWNMRKEPEANAKTPSVWVEEDRGFTLYNSGERRIRVTHSEKWGWRWSDKDGASNMERGGGMVEAMRAAEDYLAAIDPTQCGVPGLRYVARSRKWGQDANGVPRDETPLAPCPNCGSGNVEAVGLDRLTPGEFLTSVARCRDCPTSTGRRLTLQAAVWAWNVRLREAFCPDILP